ncbi:beta barrel domain-containing protein [Clostridium estertheticum]|uniref:beta barrel domain-containing protein n=1 Tax=Clostridium estertheticum TaxID=238834 RepID=UPI001C0DEE0B|nr:hypothetical protein [Clostridium estertheticum]MBU3186585.1 hypothetical protein [Clostridium estertheticum]
MNVKKGQKVWIYARMRESKITETVVVTSGAKYITTDYDSRLKFNKETLREIDGRGYGSYLILDIEEYKLEQYYNELIYKLKKFDWKIDREKLDNIAKILEINLISLK